MIRSLLLASAACALAFPAAAETVAIVNARIEPVSSAAIPSGTLVIKDGKIAALGASVQVPAGARVIDAKGGVVTPGLIAPSSNLGASEISGVRETRDDGTGNALSAAFDISYAINPASTFLGLVPSPATPELPSDTRWHPVSALPSMAFDHGPMITHAHARLVAKMSYTNIGFALAPKEFTLSTLRDIYAATLGHPVDPTNLQRVLARRGVITPTGTTARSGRSGGRPAALYRFTDSTYRVTDEFAALRPPS